ncbi:MAG TPA: hypothetical protein VMR97_07940 [Acidimicrobiales bacterium]|nr:hypothetical protein [Acidimicrobiales bacterium]
MALGRQIPATGVLSDRPSGPLAPRSSGAGGTAQGVTAPLSSAPAVAGVASVALPLPPNGQVFLVQRIAISTTSTQATTCAVYVGTPGDLSPANLIDYSYDGNADIADESSPILVPGGQTLTLVWSSMSAGSVGSARVQYLVTDPATANAILTGKAN